jgi:hypothetical protein
MDCNLPNRPVSHRIALQCRLGQKKSDFHLQLVTAAIKMPFAFLVG